MRLSPRIYPIELNFHHYFPDDMPYRVTLIKQALCRMNWEVSYIENNSGVYLSTEDDVEYLNNLKSIIVDLKTELCDKYPDWID